MSGAIAGTFADFKLIRTRDVVQIVIEVPREKADTALAALGGLPKPGAEQWVALAPLNTAAVEHDRKAQAQSPAEPLERKPLSLASKVALTCAHGTFQKFLRRSHPRAWAKAADDARRVQGLSAHTDDIAAGTVRYICGVASRSEITPGSDADGIWRTLEADYHHWSRTGGAA